MGLYCIHAIDGPGSAEKRPKLIGEHLAHVEANIDRYFVAGPLKNADGQTIGSMLVVEAADENDARDFLNQDPYAGVNLWSEIHIAAFAAVAGTSVGGAAWKK